MVMTQHYLAGELSVLLSRLQALSPDSQVAMLRRDAETAPVGALAAVASRAVRLADVLCWKALSQGDIVAFCYQVTVCAELHEFGVCSGLLDEGRTTDPPLDTVGTVDD